MKIRNGFVSNSSSSSFILDHFETTAEVALIVLYQLQMEWMEWNNHDDEWEEKDAKEKNTEGEEDFNEAIAWLQENEEFDDPILIPWTTNYETYIWKNDKGICVDTANNHDWSVLGYSFGGGEYCWDNEEDAESLDGEEEFFEGSHGEFLNLDGIKLVTRKDFCDELYKDL